ncbi:hypothetical protein B5M09_013142 [Aphanomyces astaci]|uniref:Translation elongation factor EFTu-like domain-containing protein n=1 Tax=Aphanomyces astaci TaxID=112090 RepID=A0A3R7ZMH7_APHAT|nr:hypothetical protein B5M09_013142 [Aphanomyces astaci]
MGMLVKSLDEAVNAAKGLPSNRLTPILPLSNVTGDGLDNLRHLLHCVDVEALVRSAQSFSNQDNDHTNLGTLSDKSLSAWTPPHGLSVEMPIDDTYQVPGAGFVIAGTIVTGTIKTNDVVKIGPDHNGHFHKVILFIVVVRSIESMYIPLKEVVTGQTTALGIRSLNKKQVLNRGNFRKGMDTIIKDLTDITFRKGMVLVNLATDEKPFVSRRNVEQRTIRTGDRAVIEFTFLHYAEFVKPGMRFVFRDGQAKGIGQVTRVLLPDKDDLRHNNQLDSS